MGGGDALAPLWHHVPLADQIDDFWSDPVHRRSRIWSAHRDINTIMLATSLSPGGYLGRYLKAP
jgi:hypothetical protein